MRKGANMVDSQDLKPPVSPSGDFLEPQGLAMSTSDPLVTWCERIINFGVRILAVLMTAVIVWGVADVIWMLYKDLIRPPFLLLDLSDIFALFGAFLTVLIAIEIFINITLYLREDVIHVKLVMATALMAIARKVIIFDFTVITPAYIYATATVVFALSIGYWLISQKGMVDLRICELLGKDIKNSEKNDN
jgi:uncharacterized membrane protein (DUF373 family)